MRYLLLTVFCLGFYVLIPFQFGVGDNTEELPLIYHQLGIAEYEGDFFVDSHAKRFVPVTPYVTFFVTIQKLLPFLDLHIIYFLVHGILLIILYLSIQKILRSIADIHEFSVFLCMLGLTIIGLHSWVFVPELEGIFSALLDPTTMSAVVGLFMFASFIEKQYVSFSVALVLSALIHPLYPILLLPGIFAVFFYRWKACRLCLRDTTIFGVTMFSLTLFTFVMWHISRQTIDGPIAASAVFSFNRTVSSLPMLFREWKFIDHFYYNALFLVGLGSLTCLRRTSLSSVKRVALYEVILFVSTLIIFLLGLSVIGEFYQIPTIILMNPYRISEHIIIIGWILTFAGLIQYCPNIRSLHFLHKYSALLLIVTTVALGFLLVRTLEERNYSRTFAYRTRGAMQWITNNTDSNAMIMNYAEERTRTGRNDIRTYAFRPVYFSLNSLPLTGDEQVAWFKRFLVQWDYDDSTLPHEVQLHGWDGHTINLNNVLQRSNDLVQYILIPQSRKDSFVYAGLETVYSDDIFTILKVPE